MKQVAEGSFESVIALRVDLVFHIFLCLFNCLRSLLFANDLHCRFQFGSNVANPLHESVVDFFFLDLKFFLTDE